MAKRTIKVAHAIHPGEILAEEFLKPLRITEYRLAKNTAVPPRRINEIVQGTRGITADTALRFARFFGVSPQFWMNLQARYDLARSERILRPTLSRVVVPLAEAREA